MASGSAGRRANSGDSGWLCAADGAGFADRKAIDRFKYMSAGIIVERIQIKLYRPSGSASLRPRLRVRAAAPCPCVCGI